MMDLTRVVGERHIDITLDDFESKVVDVEFPAQNTDFKGFGADVSLFA
jgi:hypothetical protein